MGPEVSWGWALQVILMAGLQGVGKTTACGKLALALQKRKKRVLMVATDVYRPAAIDQLVKLGERIQVPCVTLPQMVYLSNSTICSTASAEGSDQRLTECAVAGASV